MTDSNSPCTSTLSLDSGNSEVVSPLDSLFKSCLNVLSRDGDYKKDTPMPGLFKVLKLIDKSFNKDKQITKDGSISRLLSSLPVPVTSSSTTVTNSEESELSRNSEILTDHLNPQKIGSSVFYDSSDKGDTLTPWHLKGRKSLPNESEFSSPSPNKLLCETAMSGDCLPMDSKFTVNQHKVVLPQQQIVHEVYYSLASTNITIADSDNDIFQESIEETPPTEDTSSPNSDNESRPDALNPSGIKRSDSSITGPNQVKIQESSPSASGSASNSIPSENDNNNNEIGSENPIKLSASASPIEFCVPDYFSEEEINAPDEDIAQCVRQFVGTNISLTPHSPALARKYSEDFSNFFY